MNVHELKILKEHYNNVRCGTKTFEIRKNDRAFQKGDKVVLRLWDHNQYAWIADDKRRENDLEFYIGDVYPIDSERVVFSLLKEKP